MEVWKRESSEFVYVPSLDSVFEAWMDTHDPNWEAKPMGEIQLLRDLWAAAIESCMLIQG